MDIKIFIADAAGNRTAFVQTPFRREMYPRIGKALLEKNDLDIEQVAFVCPKPDDADGKMEMCGLEFCGNASRSYALYLARNSVIKRKDGNSFICKLHVSGFKGILSARANTDTGYASVTLPYPVSVERYSAGRFGIALDTHIHIVTMEGITHAVLFDMPDDDDIFTMIKDILIKETDTDAVGVMFCNMEENSMIPIVYVREVDSTYREGSCGSGTVAAASVLALNERSGDAMYTYTLSQPGGTVSSTVTKVGGIITSATIEGDVDIGSAFTVTL